VNFEHGRVIAFLSYCSRGNITAAMKRIKKLDGQNWRTRE